MAVAALVLGILTFVCLGPIAGILAVIFGFLGLSRAKESGVGRGMSIAGIVLGIVGTIVSIAVFLILVVGVGKAANDAANDIGGKADSNTYQLTEDQGSCEVDQFGIASYSGTIKNTSSTKKNFTVNVEFRDSSNKVLETMPDIVTDIAPGDTVQWSATTSVDVSRVTCKVASVENFFN